MYVQEYYTHYIHNRTHLCDPCGSVQSVRIRAIRANPCDPCGPVRTRADPCMPCGPVQSVWTRAHMRSLCGPMYVDPSPVPFHSAAALPLPEAPYSLGSMPWVTFFLWFPCFAGLQVWYKIVIPTGPTPPVGDSDSKKSIFGGWFDNTH